MHNINEIIKNINEIIIKDPQHIITLHSLSSPDAADSYNLITTSKGLLAIYYKYVIHHITMFSFILM